MKIELTKEEGQVLMNLINIAVQVKGLEAAEAGLYFAKKIQDAGKENEETGEVVPNGSI